MKTFAVYLFDDNKQGMERHSFLEDVHVTNPDVLNDIEGLAKQFYVDYLIVDANAGLSKLPHTVKATTLDTRITINNIKYASQTVAYIPNNGGKAIVLAERIK